MPPEIKSQIVIETKSLSEQVEDALRNAQKNKEFKDTAVRVGGARKEIMAYRTLSRFTPEALIRMEADNLGYDIIKKDRIWEPYSIEALKDKNVSSGTAYLLKKLREAYPARPENDAAKRKIYVSVANALSDAMVNVKSLKAFKEKIEIIKDKFRYYAFSSLLDPTEEIMVLWEAEMAQAEVDAAILKPQLAKAREEFNVIYYGPNTEGEAKEQMRKKTSDLNAAYQERLNASKFPDSLKNALQNLAVEQGHERYFFTNHSSYSLVKNYISKPFYNFLYNQSDSSHEAYRIAQYEYDEITPELSNEYVQKEVGNLIDDVILTKEKLALYKNPSSDPAKFEELFNDEHWCYDASFTIRGMTCWYPKKTESTPYQHRATLNNAYLPWIIALHERKQITKTDRIKQARDTYKVHDESWSWAFPVADSGTGKSVALKTGKLKMHDAKPLNFIRRIGGLKISDEDITVANIQKIFGFKAVELGKYMEDAFSREVIRHFLGAMADFCEITNMDFATLNSLNQYNPKTKGLGIWFGISGRGKASATYIPSKVVINLTKRKGQGALAHEYGHYLDSALAYIGHADTYVVSKGSIYLATDQYVFAKSWYYDDRINKNVIQNQKVAQKLFDLQHYIYKKKYPDYLKTDGKYISSEGERDDSFEYYISSNNHKNSYGSYAIDYTKREFIYDELTRKQTEILETDEALLTRFVKAAGITLTGRGLTEKDEDVIKFYMKKSGIEASTVLIPYEGKATNFSMASSIEGSYWREPTEMFARALECYIFDKLEAAGRENNYLVSGGYFDQRVYPQGNERKNIFYLYDELFKTIKEEYAIPDFKPFTTERISEVVKLTEQSGKNTGDDSESETELFDAQLKLLNEILTNELDIKYEIGGSIMLNRTLNSDELIKLIIDNK